MQIENMSFFHMPYTHKYRYSQVRFLEREHGIEFTGFEREQMESFADAKRRQDVEISGYVAWSRPPYFLLLPTTTTANISIVCKVEDVTKYPDLNQYSTVRGGWIVERIRDKFQKILTVRDIDKTKQDFGSVRPDISTKEFTGRLFEKWRNISDETQRLVAHNLVSSPTNMTYRAGGFTLSMASYSKKHASDMLLQDLNRFMPKDLTGNKPLSCKVPELGISVNLPKFQWDSNIANINDIPRAVDAKLDRIPKNTDEYSIALLKRTMGPFNFDARGMIKSDYPVILEEHVERIRKTYDVDPEIYKFIMTTRLSPSSSSPTVSQDVFKQGIAQSREKISEFAQMYLPLKVGDGQFLDMGYRAKPLSIHNLAMSFGRSDSLDTVSAETIKKASDVYFKNLEEIMKIQEQWGYDEVPPEAVMSTPQRRVWIFLRDNIGQTVSDISENTGYPATDVEKIIEILSRRSAIIEAEYGRYTAVSQAGYN